MCPAVVAAQQALQHVVGTVRDPEERPLAGAEVLIGERVTRTDARGVFRMDSLAPGVYPLTIRLIGYRPLRSRLPVVAAEPTEADYYLKQAPYGLPEIVVKGRRSGIYGVVGDTAYHPALGARVEVLGNGGGTALSDSMGRFSFPGARNGVYLVRVTLPGYAERRVMVDLRPGESRELAVLLAPGPGEPAGRMENWALQDLDRRLALGLRRSFMTRDAMERYGSRSLCDVPQIRAVTGTMATLIVNGVTVLRDWPICNWRVDEIALLEYGPEICGEASGSLAAAVGAMCSGSTRTRTPQGFGGPRGGRGGAYVVIWEKR